MPKEPKRSPIFPNSRMRSKMRTPNGTVPSPHISATKVLSREQLIRKFVRMAEELEKARLALAKEQAITLENYEKKRRSNQRANETMDDAHKDLREQDLDDEIFLKQIGLVGRLVRTRDFFLRGTPICTACRRDLSKEDKNIGIERVSCGHYVCGHCFYRRNGEAHLRPNAKCRICAAD